MNCVHSRRLIPDAGCDMKWSALSNPAKRLSLVILLVSSPLKVVEKSLAIKKLESLAGKFPVAVPRDAAAKARGSGDGTKRRGGSDGNVSRETRQSPVDAYVPGSNSSYTSPSTH